MDNPATITDVESRWRPLSDSEGINAQSLLDAAWAMLQVQAPAAASVAPGTLGETLAVHAIVSAVVRVMKNPDGNRSETVDDYSFTRDTALSAGSLYFTDDELALVGGLREVRAVSVSMDSWSC